MNKARSTRRTLALSIMAICLCCVMLIGTTFAWFTDTATSGLNHIQSGSLDLDVQYTLDGETWHPLDDATDLFGGEDAKFEPGYTRVVAFRLKNKGNLAFKYRLTTNVAEEIPGTNVFGNEFKLSDYLETSYAHNGVNQIGDILISLAFGGRNSQKAIGWDKGTFDAEYSVDDSHALLPGSAGHYVIMKVTMPVTIGNEANAKDANSMPEIHFGVNVVATQATIERDSYDTQYDKNAAYPVTSASELQNAFVGGGVLNVTEDIVPDKTLVVNGSKVTLNAAGQTVSNVGANDLWNETNYDWSLVSAQNGANLTITDGEFLAKKNDCFAVDVQDGSTVTIKNGTYVGNVHAVYVFEGTLIVEGGTFSVQQKYSDATKADEFVLNCYDANRANGTAKIVVKGGTFIDFNPADCQAEGAHTNFVADGYKVVSETKGGHTYYTVVAE